MNYFTRLLILGVFALMATACVEDSSSITRVGDSGPIDEANLSNALIAGTQSSILTSGYLFSSEVADGRWEHHLVLSSSDVSRDGDLFGEARMATEVVFESPSADITGTYTEFRNGVRQWYNFGEMFEQQLADRRITDGSLVIAATNDGGYLVNLKSDYGNGFELTGNYEGELRQISITGSEPVVDADFTGTSQITYNRTRMSAERVYARGSTDQTGNVRLHSLYVARNAADQNGRLTGRSDVMIINLDATSTVPTGRFEVGFRAQSEGVGYFSRQNGVARSFTLANWCTNMNFINGTYDDDEPTDDGTAIVRYDGETLDLRMDVRTFSDSDITIDYSGPLTVIID